MILLLMSFHNSEQTASPSENPQCTHTTWNLWICFTWKEELGLGDYIQSLESQFIKMGLIQAQGSQKYKKGRKSVQVGQGLVVRWIGCCYFQRRGWGGDNKPRHARVKKSQTTTNKTTSLGASREEHGAACILILASDTQHYSYY